jgi:hypothetical protein
MAAFENHLNKNIFFDFKENKVRRNRRGSSRIQITDYDYGLSAHSIFIIVFKIDFKILCLLSRFLFETLYCRVLFNGMVRANDDDTLDRLHPPNESLRSKLNLKVETMPDMFV